MIQDVKKAFQYFRNRFVMKRTAQNWYAFDDPFDVNGEGKKKMAVHFQYQVVKCWTYEYKVNLVQFVMDYEQLDYYNAKELINSQTKAAIDLEILAEVNGTEIVKSDAYLPEGFTSLLSGKGVIGNRARKYLLDRKFDIEKLDSLGFGYCNKKAKEPADDYFGYIIIPFFKKGLLQYYIGRDFIGNFLRYKNPKKEAFGVGKADLLYNEDALLRHKTVYLTEGWADAATLGEKGIASLGWSLSDTQKQSIMTSKIKELVVVPDADFYQEALKTAMPFLEKFKVKVVNFDSIKEFGKDVNDVCKSGNLNMVFDLIKQTPHLTFGDAIKFTMSEAERKKKLKLKELYE